MNRKQGLNNNAFFPIAARFEKTKHLDVSKAVKKANTDK